MLIELEDFKKHNNLDTNDYDDILTIYINAAGDFIKEYLGRIIESASVTEYFDGDDIKDKIFLSNFPVTALTSLQYNSGTFGTPVWTAFSADDYQRDDDQGIIYMDTMYSGIRNIKVVYVAGYDAASIPNAIKVACMKMVGKMFNKRRSDGFSVEEVSNASITWDTFISSDIQELLAPFRKIKI